MSWLFSTLVRGSHPEFVDGEFRFLLLVTLKCRPFLFLLIPVGSSLELHCVSAASSINWEICFTWIFANSFIFPTSEAFESSPVALSKKRYYSPISTSCFIYLLSVFFVLYFFSSSQGSMGDFSFIFLSNFYSLVPTHYSRHLYQNQYPLSKKKRKAF